MNDVIGAAAVWDVEVLARTVFGEARGESDAGKAAVAWVWVNRSRDHQRRWPATVAGCCLQPLQASAWNTNNTNRAKCIAADETDPTFATCLATARLVLAGDLVDPADGATHYLTETLAETMPPSWFNPAKVVARIGHHMFLKL